MRDAGTANLDTERETRREAPCAVIAFHQPSQLTAKECTAALVQVVDTFFTVKKVQEDWVRGDTQRFAKFPVTTFGRKDLRIWWCVCLVKFERQNQDKTVDLEVWSSFI